MSIPSNVYSFNEYIPVIHETAYVHPMATVIGNVTLGINVYVGPGAVIRGDWGEVIIEDGCNIQENSVIHMYPGVTVHLKERTHVGHGAIVHGAKIEEDVLIGMNAVILDDAEIGANCVVHALSLVPTEMKIPPRKIVAGNPAKIVSDVSDKQLRWKKDGQKLYTALPTDCRNSLVPVEPRRRPPKDKPKQESVFKPWKD